MHCLILAVSNIEFGCLGNSYSRLIKLQSVTQLLHRHFDQNFLYYLLERPTWGLGVLYSVGSPPRSISVRPAKCRDLETKICALARIKVQLSLVNSARLLSALADTVCIATLDERLSRKTLASLPQPPYVETAIGCTPNRAHDI